MSYSNIKRFLSATLLFAFMTPAAFAISESAGASPLNSSMTLSGNVKLTDANELITLSLRDSDVRQVLRMFADKAGKNIIFHNSVRGNVTLDLVNTPINEAFNLVLQVTNLSYYEQGNAMIVIASNHPDNATFSKQEMMMFPVKYVSASKIAEFLNKNVFGMKKSGVSSIDAATVNTATNELIVFGMPSDIPIVKKVIDQFDREPLSKTFTVNHTTPAEMANMICDLLLPANGVKTKSGASTGGAASVSSGDDELKLGEGILACSSESSSSTSISPFDVQSLSIAYFPQRGTITMMGGSDAQAALVEKFIKTNDVKQPQAMLEVSIVELNEAGSKEFQNLWSVAGKHWSATFNGTQVQAGRSHETPWTSKTEYIFDGGTNVEGMAAGQLPNGMPYAVFDEAGRMTGMTLPQQVARTIWHQVPSVHVNWAMNYLIENRKARVLANPKIIITNGKESTIDLTQDYVEKVTSEFLTSALAGAGSTGTVQTVYSIGSDLGIKVALTPFISPEGYVTLNIRPDYATIADQVYATGETGARELAATLLSRRNLDLKNVRIKDGETLVIGGMIQEVETKSVNKIPFLGDLPLIGSAFRSSSTTKQKSELVIMITPKILTDGDDGVVSTAL